MVSQRSQRRTFIYNLDSMKMSAKFKILIILGNIKYVTVQSLKCLTPLIAHQSNLASIDNQDRKLVKKLFIITIKSQFSMSGI